MNTFPTDISSMLRRGSVGVLATDTIYGIVGPALNKGSVARVYRIRKRNPKKPFIVLIGDIRELSRFKIRLSQKMLSALKTVWPGKVSVILPLPTDKEARRRFRYLHRGTNTIAFRLPDQKKLRTLLKKAGPLIAPSANPEGKPPANSITAARRYFKRNVDFYVAGRTSKIPSTLISLDVKGDVRILRQGAVRIAQSPKL